MKKPNKINPIDSLIEKLAKGFANIDDFEKLQETEEGQKMFDFIVKSVSDMETFQSLFLNITFLLQISR